MQSCQRGIRGVIFPPEFRRNFGRSQNNPTEMTLSSADEDVVVSEKVQLVEKPNERYRSTTSTSSRRYKGFLRPGKFLAHRVSHKDVLKHFYCAGYHKYRYTVICSYCNAGKPSGYKFNASEMQKHLSSCVVFAKSSSKSEGATSSIVSRRTRQTTLTGDYGVRIAEKDRTVQVNHRVAESTVLSGVPFRFWELESTQALFEDAQRASWVGERGVLVPLPKRRKIPELIGLSENDENSLYKDIVNQMKSKFDGLRISGYTLVCDGWVDNIHRSLIAFFVCFENQSYYVMSFDEKRAKTTQFHLDCIEKVFVRLESWGLSRKNCVMFASDGATNVRSAGEILERESQIPWGWCLAHGINLFFVDAFGVNSATSSNKKAKRSEFLFEFYQKVRKVVTVLRKNTLINLAKQENLPVIPQLSSTRFLFLFPVLEKLSKKRLAFASIMDSEE